jgi:hypothetical protein
VIAFTSRTPFMIETPKSAAKPTPVETFRFIPRAKRATAPPMNARGTEVSRSRAARWLLKVTKRRA